MSTVNLVVCKCKSCTHWEAGKNEDGTQFLLCRTCGVILPITANLDEAVAASSDVHFAPHPLHQWSQRPAHPHHKL